MSIESYTTKLQNPILIIMAPVVGYRVEGLGCRVGPGYRAVFSTYKGTLGSRHVGFGFRQE